MNYGKEAYLKAAELEERLLPRLLAGVSEARYDTAIPGGVKTRVAALTGAALVAVCAESDGAGKAEIYFGGKKVCALAAGGPHTAVFAARTSGDVELLPGTGTTVTGVYLCALGKGALTG